MSNDLKQAMIQGLKEVGIEIARVVGHTIIKIAEGQRSKGAVDSKGSATSMEHHK